MVRQRKFCFIELVKQLVKLIIVEKYLVVAGLEKFVLVCSCFLLLVLTLAAVSISSSLLYRSYLIEWRTENLFGWCLAQVLSFFTILVM